MLTDKVAVVTGANRGIGRAILMKIAENHGTIIACVRKETDEFIAEIQMLSEKYQVEIHPLTFDLTREEEIKTAAVQMRKLTKKVDILVNNAGMIPEPHSFVMTGANSIRQVMEANFVGPMILTQYVARMMIRNQSGSIINFSSIAALDGEPGELEYVASKGAIASATRKLAIELGEYGIRVNALAPGLIDTAMGGAIDEENEAKLDERRVLKRRGSTEEIAEAVLYLASDKSSYVTGQVLRVDGGMR
ncbi:MAG: SDR family oxidoreductase [Eubacterium sp.]|nr:SDR family oxidoreductase [Eubacterium sp.]